MSGRRAQAARNNELILQAAREVFIADPGAPISAVADRAGVGISALYRRYASKEELLQTLCGDGLRRYITETETALTDLDAGMDPWEAFGGWMRRLVDADSSSLTVRLAGTFTPTAELFQDATLANELTVRFFDRVKEADVLRDDLDVADIAMVQEQLTAIRIGDRERMLDLRHRYLTLALDGMRAPARTPLPGSTPTWQELSGRWRPQ
ncbi:TetR/AcrR family transcriptional regulator [Streptosporangiaceae bacterium NEAU-GS5]|nr:TetR/AcrR family transcriptional regulator [Streptosporangiaceae bacterium NEAU-GS5]